jgi:hypothetical protein
MLHENREDIKGKNGEDEKEKKGREEQLGVIFVTIKGAVDAKMPQNIGNSGQDIDKKKKAEKKSGWMAEEIFLNAKGEKQSQSEAKGSEYVEEKGHFLAGLPGNGGEGEL